LKRQVNADSRLNVMRAAFVITGDAADYNDAVEDDDDGGRL